MDDVSTSGPIEETFISEAEIRTTYEEVPSRGFNALMKVRRQGRWFMLKGLKTAYRDQTVYIELLRKEYALMVELDHPNIVKAYAKEENEVLGPCIVMEYIDGVRLDEFLSGKPTATVRRKVLDQLVDALSYIHSKQILHRDLKPGNILVTRNGGNVKIIDLGLGDADDYAILKQPAGTRDYMAPEQIHPGGAIMDCRSDIYAFGLILRKLFSHRYRHIAARCIRENPDGRYQSMEEVKMALERSDRRRRWLPFLGMCLVLALSLLLPLRRHPAGAPEVSPDERMTADEREYRNAATWSIVVPFNRLLQEAEKGKEYREILQARLIKLNNITSRKCEEMAYLYEEGSPERLRFLSQVKRDQEGTLLPALRAVERRAPSIEEEFRKGILGERALDSLKWVLSPGIVTLSASEVTATSALGGVQLLDGTYAGGNRGGLCWGPCHNPTTEDRSAEPDGADGRVRMNGLAPGTTYFMRSYVETSAGTTYGSEESFTTADSTLVVPEGALPALFTVAPGRQVFFSRGNLQYRASTETWRLAEHQTDCIGKANLNRSATYDGWIDLFGWGTSGYDHGAVNYEPWSFSSDTRSNALHNAYGKPQSHLYESGGKADWGYNRIENGGGQEHLWRTPRVQEMVYLLYNRNTASGVNFAKARVSGVNGLILLPDNWRISVYPLNAAGRPEAKYNANLISEADWTGILEPAGAVFLPEAGAVTVSGYISRLGAYYSADASSTDAWHFLIAQDNLLFDIQGHRSDGLSVRLVQDAEE